jgi:hypothetical protein
METVAPGLAVRLPGDTEHEGSEAGALVALLTTEQTRLTWSENPPAVVMVIVIGVGLNGSFMFMYPWERFSDPDAGVVKPMAKFFTTCIAVPELAIKLVSVPSWLKLAVTVMVPPGVFANRVVQLAADGVAGLLRLSVDTGHGSTLSPPKAIVIVPVGVVSGNCGVTTAVNVTGWVATLGFDDGVKTTVTGAGEIF